MDALISNYAGWAEDVLVLLDPGSSRPSVKRNENSQVLSTELPTRCKIPLSK